VDNVTSLYQLRKRFTIPTRGTTLRKAVRQSSTGYPILGLYAEVKKVKSPNTVSRGYLHLWLRLSCVGL